MDQHEPLVLPSLDIWVNFVSNIAHNIKKISVVELMMRYFPFDFPLLS